MELKQLILKSLWHLALPILWDIQVSELSDKNMQITLILENSHQRKRIDLALVRMIATDMQPPSIVEDKGFRDFLKVIDRP